MTEKSKTVDEALRVLLCVADSPGTIADLTRRTAISRTAVQRLLMSLAEQGFVLRMPDGRFGLGLTVARLAGQVTAPLSALARPHLDRLAAKLNETIVLTLRQADEAVSVAQATAPDRMVRVEYPPGYRHPLRIAAGGRAILASADAETVERICRGDPDPAGLRRSLETVRSAGYAVSVDELQAGVAGLAAPVLTAGGVAVASLGVIAPVDRFDPAGLEREVRAAAAELSAAFSASA